MRCVFSAVATLVGSALIFLPASAQTTANALPSTGGTVTGVLTIAPVGTAATQSIDGGGFFDALPVLPFDNRIGINLGNVPAANGTIWRIARGVVIQPVHKTAGISEALSVLYLKAAFAGDGSMMRMYHQFHDGGAQDASGEGHTSIYVMEDPLSTPTGTVTSGGTGTTALGWKQNGNCGLENAAATNCTGGGGYTLRTTAPLLSTTVSAMTSASYDTWGTLTVPNTLIPTPYAAVPTGFPALSPRDNFVTGISRSVTIGTTANGTPAASGVLCVTGSQEPTTEELPYTLSGKTLTISGQRFPHMPTATVFFGKCTYVESPMDTTYQGGSKAVYTVLGNVDANRIAFATSDGGTRTSHFGAFNAFQPGIAGRNAINLWDGAYALGGMGASTGYLADIDGPQPLAYNSVPWVAGDTVEEAHQPANLHTLENEYCQTNLPGKSGQNSCKILVVSGNYMNSVHRIVLNNALNATSLCVYPSCTPLDGRTTGGATGYLGVIPEVWRIESFDYLHRGAYANLFTLFVPPVGNVFYFDGCASGDTSTDCHNSPVYGLWADSKGVLGYQNMYYERKTGQFTFGLSHPVFTHPVSAPAYHESLSTPASSSATCSAGDFTDDANYHYVCVATNTWKRAALSAF